MPTMRRSEMTSSGYSRRTRLRASAPELAARSRYPAELRISTSTLAISRSSSTTTMVLRSVSISCTGCHHAFPLERKRQRNYKGRPAALLFQSDLAVMIAYDRLADGQTHSGAFSRILGGKERIEHPIPEFVVHPRTIVLKDQAHPLAPALNDPLGADPQRAARLRHRVQRIHTQVDEHLLELIDVAIGQQRRRTQFAVKADVAAVSLGFQQMQRTLDDRPHVAGDSDRLAAPAEVQQHPHDPGDAIDLIDDDFQAGIEPHRVGSAAQQMFGPAPDYAQRSADFVGQARSQGTDGGQLVGMAQAALQFQLALALIQQAAARHAQFPRQLAKLL